MPTPIPTLLLPPQFVYTNVGGPVPDHVMTLVMIVPTDPAIY